MSSLKAKILSSKIVNHGLIGKCKDYIYTKFISDRLEAKTDDYRTEILNDFYKIYDNEPWILGFGSFLRYYRDHTVDGQDIDILIEKSVFDSHKQELKDKGYALVGVFTDHEGKISEYKLRYKEAEIDIFFVYQNQDGYYYQSTYIDPDHKDLVMRSVVDGNRIVSGEGYCMYRKKLPDFVCKDYEYDGILFKGYGNPEKQLENEYGEWQIPSKEFRWFTYPEWNLPIKFPNAKVIYYNKIHKDY